MKPCFIGALAQLGERHNGIVKVRGSIPLGSKKKSLTFETYTVVSDNINMKSVTTTHYLLFSLLFISLNCTAPQTRSAAPAEPAYMTVEANGVQAKNQKEGDAFFFEQMDDEKGVTLTAQPEKKSLSEADRIGFASWYGKEMQNKPTASGELYDLNKYTAAHRTLPMGTVVLVKCNETGKKQLVRVNDRGPYVEGRLIDVSYAAARDLGFAEKGVAQVEIEVIQLGKNDFLSKAAVQPESESPGLIAPVARSEKKDELELEPEELSGAEKAITGTNAWDYIFADKRSPAGNVTVQVGAFKKRVNAEKFRGELEERYGRRGFIASKNGFHFVWLGDFSSDSEAKKFFSRLKRDGIDALLRKNT